MESESTFAVPGGKSSEVLKPVEATLYAVAELVQCVIVWALHLAADLGWDDGFSTDAFDGSDDRIGVVAPVCHDDLSLAAGQ